MKTWMKINKLKLNDDKTEMLVMCHPSLKHEIQDIALKIGSFGSFVLEGLRSKVAFRKWENVMLKNESAL